MLSTTRAALPLPRSGAISYRELEEWSGRIAVRLAEQGVRSGSKVLILARPAIAAAAAVLGAQRAGAAPAVLDPADADERIAAAAADCAAAVVVGALAGRLENEGLAVVRADECRDAAADSERST